MDGPNANTNLRRILRQKKTSACPAFIDPTSSLGRIATFSFVCKYWRISDEGEEDRHEPPQMKRLLLNLALSANQTTFALCHISLSCQLISPF